MKIIDMRLRPPYRSIHKSGLYTGMAGKLIVAEKRGVTISDSARLGDMDMLIKEMDELGVVYGVAAVRRQDHGENEDILSLVKEYPDHFIGAWHVDPLMGDAALEEIEKNVLAGPCKAVVMEGGRADLPEKWYLDDKRVFPVYDLCQEKGIPVLFTFGGKGVADQSYYNPVAADRMGYAFPKLKAVFSHGGWPFVTQMCHAAVQHPNFFISPDSWGLGFAPGTQAYVDAANWQLQDQMMFGTAYPSVSLKSCIDYYTSVLRDEVVEKYMYRNAARLFGLED